MLGSGNVCQLTQTMWSWKEATAARGASYAIIPTMYVNNS